MKISDYFRQLFPIPPHARSSLFRRNLSRFEAKELASKLTNAFFTPISEKRVQKVASLLRLIENGMIGRCAGDVDDYILYYFMRYYSALNLNRTKGAHVEIGALFGGGLILSLYALKAAKVKDCAISIDPLNGYYDLDLDPGTGYRVCQENILSNIERFKLQDQAFEIIQARSRDEEAQRKVSCFEIKSLWIDGDHSLVAIREDWENYSQMVVENGFVLIDNYHDEAWPDVTRYVDEYLLPKAHGWRVALVMGRSILLQRKLPSS